MVDSLARMLARSNGGRTATPMATPTSTEEERPSSEDAHVVVVTTTTTSVTTPDPFQFLLHKIKATSTDSSVDIKEDFGDVLETPK